MRRPWKPQVDDANEKEQMLAIQKAFIQYIAQGDVELPKSTLATKPVDDSVLAECEVEPEDFNLTLLQKLLGTEFLAPEIEEMLSQMCSYRNEIDERTFGKAHRNGPRQLMLEDITRWLLAISKRQADNALLKEINERINYLEAVIDSNIFLPERCFETMRDHTMYALLLQLKRWFKYTIAPKVERYVRFASAREDISTLISKLNGLVSDAAPSLFYLIMQQEVKTVGFTLDKLITDAIDFKEEVSTLYGQSIKMLALAIEQTNIANPFFDIVGKIILPVKDKTWHDLLDERASVAKIFRREQTVQQIIYTQGLIVALSRLIQSWQDAFELAGDGGNLMVYGVAKKKVEALIHASEILLRKIQDNFSMFIEQAEEYYLQINTKQQKPDPAWEANYRTAKGYCGKLKELLELSLNQLSEIRNKIVNVSFNQILDKTENDLSRFNQSTEKVVADLKLWMPAETTSITVGEQTVLSVAAAMAKLSPRFATPQGKQHNSAAAAPAL